MGRDIVAPAVAVPLAVAGFLFDVAAFYPGLVSFDSAYIWWQTRGGESTDIHSPALMFVWRILETVHSGPGPMFVLHDLLIWSGLALLALGLQLRPLATFALMTLVGLAPAPLILRAHIWTDVAMLGALLVVAGALAYHARTSRRNWLLLALAAGLYALGSRHNAVLALLPLLFLGVRQSLTSPGTEPTSARVGVVSYLLLAALVLSVQAIHERVDRKVAMWPVIAYFDLAALSVDSNHMLLPDFVRSQDLTVAEMRQSLRSWSVTSLLLRRPGAFRDPLAPYWTKPELAKLRSDWIAAIVEHPGAYLAHRLRFGAALFGAHPRDWPRSLIYVNEIVPYRDNPAVEPNGSALHQALFRQADRLAATPLLAPWPYLLIGLVAAPWIWRKRGTPRGAIALALVASSALYSLPLVIVAPAAELRYLLWPMAASLIAAVLAFARSPDDSPSRFAEPRGPTAA